jgi:hypothetical protein
LKNNYICSILKHVLFNTDYLMIKAQLRINEKRHIIIQKPLLTTSVTKTSTIFRTPMVNKAKFMCVHMGFSKLSRCSAVEGLVTDNLN